MRCLWYGLAAILIVITVATSLPAQVKPPDKTSKTDKADKPSQKPITELGGKTLQQWMQDAKDSDAAVRHNAVRTIMLFGPSAKPAAQTLIARLGDPDASVRINSAIALANIEIDPTDAPKAVAELTNRMSKDPESVVRYQAAMTLAGFNKAAKPAIPYLINAINDKGSWEIRKAACLALGSAGQATKEEPLDMRAANALIQHLNSESSASVRLQSIMSLWGMGRPVSPTDRSAIEGALKRAMERDRDKTVQIWATVALMASQDESPEKPLPEKLLDGIAKQLKSPELSVRSQAAQALGTIGPRAKPRVKDLADLLSDKQDDAVLAAVLALANIGEEAKDALSALKTVSDRKDENKALQQAAREAIGVISGKKK